MVSYHPRGTVSNVWRQFLVVTAVGVSAKGLQWVEARDAALYPPVHRMPLHQKMIPPQTSQHWVEQPWAISGAWASKPAQDQEISDFMEVSVPGALKFLPNSY